MKAKEFVEKWEWVMGRRADIVSPVLREVLRDFDSTLTDAWVSVKDRLPDPYESIIVYDEFCGVLTAWLLSGEFVTDDGRNYYVPLHNTTHWMPMPKPPKV